MDSSPRRWVLKPLSPLLQPSDLRTIVGPSQSNMSPQDVVVQDQQDGASTSDEWCPSSPSSPSSSAGSPCGFYSFVEDPSSLEAELNEAWMVSSQRQAQLATLKQEQGFKLQTYNSGRRPDSLFPNNTEDARYLVDPSNGVEVVGEVEEQQLRKEIIRTQAPKKGPMAWDQPSPTMDLDLRGSSDMLREGFSTSPSPVSSRPDLQQTPIDKEKIDFNAVRQQFLRMEQDRQMALLSPLKSPKTFSRQQSSGASSNFKTVSTSGVETQGTRSLTMDERAPQGKAWMFGTGDSLGQQESVFDELDSGAQELLVDVGHASNESHVSDTTAQDNGTQMFPISCETPIQREIRLVQEREENLRRSRGLKLDERRGEMVEIRTRRLQPRLNPLKAKDTYRMSFTVHQRTKGQNEEETRRPDSSDPPPGETHGSESEPSEEAWRAQLRAQAAPGTEGASLSPCCPHRHPDEDEFGQKSPPSFTERDSGVRGAREFLQDQRGSWSPTGPKFWREKLQSSGLQSRGQGAPDFIEKEIEESVRREQELKELRELRETQLLSPPPLVEQAAKTAVGLFYPPVKADKASSPSSARPSVRLSSVSFFTAQPWASSPSPLVPSSSPMAENSAPSAQRGLTETLLRDFEERRGKLRPEESSYAGIHLVDNINNEVVESTRVIRHKNRRALRWEAGQFANEEHQ